MSNETPSTQILVIRHAETEWNIEGRMQGHGDSPLTEQGVRQTEALARRLASVGLHAIYASDLPRAWRTASTIGEKSGIAPQVDPRLRERKFGELEGLTWAQVEARFPEVHAKLQDPEPDYRVPGGESSNDVIQRVQECLMELSDRHPGEKVAVVTHGGVLGRLFRVVTGVPLHAPRRFSLLNTSVNTFERQNGNLVLKSWGDTEHLQKLTEPLDDA